jgi:hypothetical protein
LTIKQIITGLESKDSKAQLKAVTALKTEGNRKVLNALAYLLATNKDASFEKEILEIFSSLKDSASNAEIILILKNEELVSIRQKVLSTIWNTQIDYSYYLADFVEIACEGDFLTTLDCLTIMEAMLGPFEERHVLESQWHLKEFMESNEPKEERKMAILSDIAIFVKDADSNVEE